MGDGAATAWCKMMMHLALLLWGSRVCAVLVFLGYEERGTVVQRVLHQGKIFSSLEPWILSLWWKRETLTGT